MKSLLSGSAGPRQTRHSKGEFEVRSSMEGEEEPDISRGAGQARERKPKQNKIFGVAENVGSSSVAPMQFFDVYNCSTIFLCN